MKTPLRFLLATTVFSFAAFAQQAAACYDDNGFQICKGDRVLFMDDWSREQLGTVNQIFTNAKAEIHYTDVYPDHKTGLVSWRKAGQIVTELKDDESFHSVRKNATVLLPNFFSELCKGTVLAVFRTGRALVRRNYSSGKFDNTWWDTKELFAQVSKHMEIEVGDCVVFNDKKETRTGTVTGIFANNHLSVTDASKKEYFPHLLKDEVAKSTECVRRK
jgi:hypothetical protein